jgi:hypothetical protein
MIMNLNPRHFALIALVSTAFVGCQAPSTTSTTGDEVLDETLALMVQVDHMTVAKRYDWCIGYMPRLWIDAPFTLESGCEALAEDWPKAKAQVVALSLLTDGFDM